MKNSQTNQQNKFRLPRYLLPVLASSLVTFLLWIGNENHKTTHPGSGRQPELYANQTADDLTQAYLNAIKRAQKSILLIVYSLSDRSIIDGLKKRSLEGIDIKVICDAKASPSVDYKLGSAITTIKRFGIGLMHLKILVIDEKEIWIGSANMTSESLRMHGNLVAALESPEIANYVATKAAVMQTGVFGMPWTERSFDVGGQNIELWFLPNNAQAINKLKSMLAAAQKTIKIAMFTWTRYDLAQAVVEAKKRGVEVEVVIDHYSGKGVSSKVAALLKAGGVSVSLSRGNSLLHHKFMYIDNKSLINGSANWTKAAFKENDDCFIVIPQLNEEQQKRMEALWKVISNEGARL